MERCKGMNPVFRHGTQRASSKAQGPRVQTYSLGPWAHLYTLGPKPNIYLIMI